MSETKKKLESEQEFHIKALMIVLKSDPIIDDHSRDYEATEGYLWELIEKDGSVIKGIISALECHLNK